MARFSALASDTSEEDEQYATSPPKKNLQKKTRPAFPPPRVQRVDEDAEMASDSESSRADEEELHSDSSQVGANNQRTFGRAGAGIYPTEDPEEGEGREESGDSSASSSDELLPEHRRGNSSIIPWAQRIGVDPQKMHVMQASLFPRTDSAAETLKPSNAEKPDRARLTPNGVHRKHSRDSVGDGVRAMTQEVC